MFLLLAIALVSCSSSAEKKEAKKQVSLEATSADALQPLMAKTQANLRYLIYGLMNFDKVKVEKSTANLVVITDYTSQNTQFSARGGGAAEWEAMCDEQRTLVEEIKQHFLSENYDGVSTSFGRLLGVCMKCHRPYRHLN